MNLPEILLSLIPWRLVAAGVFALVFAETLTLLLSRARCRGNDTITDNQYPQ